MLHIKMRLVGQIIDFVVVQLSYFGYILGQLTGYGVYNGVTDLDL